MTHTFVLVEFKHRECFTSDGRLFAKHQTLSYWCWIFSSWSRSRKLGVYQFQRFFVYCCHNNIDFTKTYIFNKFQSIVNHWWKFCSDQARVKSLLKRFKIYRYGLWKSISKHLKLCITDNCWDPDIRKTPYYLYHEALVFRVLSSIPLVYVSRKYDCNCLSLGHDYKMSRMNIPTGD